MQRWLTLSALFILTVPTFGAEGDTPPRLRLLVPAYFYPVRDGLKDWQRLSDAAVDVPIVAIVNPASGPGKKVDATYQDVLAKARKAGVTLIGYVSTSYAKRPAADVKADVDRWVEFYPNIQGIFFDEQTSRADKVDYYADLAQHARGKIDKALIVANPGTVCASEYLTKPTADVVCVFEHHTEFDKFKLPTWAEKLPAERFAALPYKTADAELMRTRVAAAVSGKIGYLYVTDDEGNNPWDRLPTYWPDLVEAVKQVNKGGKP
jgi:Spherulation-specific family 4